MIGPRPVIVMLTDSQLAEEIADTRDEVCCSCLLAASRSLCGCGGRAAEWLERLLAEQRRRADESAVAS